MSQVAYLIFPDHVGIRTPDPPDPPDPAKPPKPSPPPLVFTLVGLVLTVHMFIAPHKLHHSKKLQIWCHCCSLSCNTTYILKDSKNLLFFCRFFFTSDSLVDGVCAADWWLLPRPTHLRPVSDMVKMQHAVLRPWILNPAGLCPLSQPAHGVTSGALTPKASRREKDREKPRERRGTGQLRRQKGEEREKKHRFVLDCIGRSLLMG